MIHRLIADTFIDNDDPDNKKMVNHKDGNKLNNHVSNLEWTTAGENNLHAIKTGLRKIHTRPIIITDSEGDSFEYQTHEEAAKCAKINSRTIRDALKNGTKPFGWSIVYKNTKDIKVNVDLSEFKTIIKYPNYMINPSGDIYGKTSKRILQIKPKNANGYLVLSLRDNIKKNKRVQIYLHKILAETFIPNPNKLPEVNHIDHNKSNCSLENLEWCDRATNMRKCAEFIRLNKSVLNHESKDSDGSGENSEVEE